MPSYGWKPPSQTQPQKSEPSDRAFARECMNTQQKMVADGEQPSARSTVSCREAGKSATIYFSPADHKRPLHHLLDRPRWPSPDRSDDTEGLRTVPFTKRAIVAKRTRWKNQIQHIRQSRFRSKGRVQFGFSDKHLKGKRPGHQYH
jgi:hypothetical protein